VLLSNSEFFNTSSFPFLAAFHSAAMGVGPSTLDQLKQSFQKNQQGEWGFHGHLLATASAIGNVIAFAMIWVAWSVSDDAGVTISNDNRKVMLTIAASYTVCFVLAILELRVAFSKAAKTYLSFAVHATSLFSFLMTFGLYSALSGQFANNSNLEWSWYTAMAFTTIGVSARFAWKEAVHETFADDKGQRVGSQMKSTFNRRETELSEMRSTRPSVSSRVVRSERAPNLGRRSKR